MEKKRVHVFISGRVQGVFFRAYTRDTARKLDLSGWVRNTSDGRVEAVFEGGEENVRTMTDWCNEGSPLGRVDKVEMREEDYAGEFTSFDIVR
jgi:acylphosphatase